MHYKNGAVDKLDAKKYKVYIHTAKNLYLVTKPAISPTGVTGDISQVKDQAEAEEIRNPSTPGLVKKHKHDLNIFTRTQIADSVSNVTVKKGDIYEYSLTISHSKVNWDKIGEVVGGIFGITVGLALVGALVYWFTLT
jgi:hypothetical protein